MNYYEHHIGDYDADTAHLSWAEDMAYTRLMRLYYRKESPIPADITQACRLVRAQSKEERKAVEVVLSEFFELRDDGWHQSRCDSELQRHQKKLAALKDLQERDSYRRFREYVIQRDGKVCSYCGRSDVPLQLDHVIPRSRGGSDDPENLTPACRPCNTSKGSKLLSEWRS